MHYNQFTLYAAAIFLSSFAAAAPQASPFTYYSMLTPLAGLCDITTGPDGVI